VILGGATRGAAILGGADILGAPPPRLALGTRARSTLSSKSAEPLAERPDSRAGTKSAPTGEATATTMSAMAPKTTAVLSSLRWAFMAYDSPRPAHSPVL
jgi:hypothetical protein